MSDTTDIDQDALLAQLADEFLNQAKRGEQPSIDEYCERYPIVAADIRDLFPTLVAMEDLQPSGGYNQRIDDAPDLPDQIGDYRIVGEIGRGGMGIVYEAEQESLRRRVALKVLPQTATANSESSRTRFRREARAAAKMHHTNIVPVFEVGQDGEHIFYAMQLIQGLSLDHVIDELKDEAGGTKPDTHYQALGQPISARSSNTPVNKTLDAAISDSTTVLVKEVSEDSNSGRRHFYRSTAKIGMQVADALAFAHHRKVIHRDIKPANLLLDATGVVWVTDFGLAKTEDDNLTKTGDFLGTLRYMSPERFQGKCDERADIYALGVTLYELLLQRPAFAASDRLKLINLISESTPVRPRTIDRNLPRDLETIILKSIEREPKARYRSAKAMYEDLYRFVNDQPIVARRLSVFEQITRWAGRNKSLAVALASIAALLVLLTVGGFAFSIHQSTLRQSAELDSDRAKLAQQQAENQRTVALEERTAAQRAKHVAEQSEKQRRRSQYFAEVSLATQRLERIGNTSRLKELTNRWRNEIDQQDMGWEWYYLRSISLSVPTACQVDTVVNDISFSPDDEFVVVAGFNKDAYIIDCATGKTVRRLVGHSDNIEAVAWHPTDGLIATAGRDKTARLWSFETGKCLETVETDGQSVTEIAWDSQGHQLAFSVLQNGTLMNGISRVSVVQFKNRKLDAPIESAIIELPSIENFACNKHLEFSPDGTRIAATMARGEYRQNKKIAVWNVADKKIAMQPLSAAGITWAQDGYSVGSYLTASKSGEIHLHDAETGLSIQRFSGHTSYLTSFDFSHDGRSLLTAGYDNTVRIWDVHSGHQLRVFQEHKEAIRSARWNHASDRVLSGSWNKTTLIWNVETTHHRIFMNNPDKESPFDSTIQLNWHPDSVRLATSGTTDWLMSVHDTNARSRQSTSLSNFFNRCVWNPDGTRVAYSGDVIRIWDPAKTRWLNVEDKNAASHDIAWHPNGTQFATPITLMKESGEKSFAIRIFDAWSGKSTTELRPGDEAWSAIAWHPTDHAQIAVASKSGLLKVVDINSQEIIAENSFEGTIPRIEWNATGTTLACAFSNGSIRLLDNNLNTTHVLPGHNNKVNQVSWHPDGRRLASAANDSSVKVWDVRTGTQILSLDDHRSAVHSVDWSPNGRKLASGDMSGHIIVRDATAGFDTQR